MWTAFYFTPCPVPSCPAYEPNSNDGEYLHPFRHIQYKRIASLRPIATFAMLRGLTKSYGERLPKCGTEQMNREIAKGLSPELRAVLEPLLGEIDPLKERITQ